MTVCSSDGNSSNDFSHRNANVIYVIHFLDLDLYRPIHSAVESYASETER